MDPHGQAHRPRGIRSDRWMRLWAEHEAALQAIEASLAAFIAMIVSAVIGSILFALAALPSDRLLVAMSPTWKGT